MRILMLSQEVPPETGWGGIGTYVFYLASAMAAQGAEVHVLSVVPDQERKDQTVAGFHIHRRPLSRPRGVGRATRLPQAWDRLSLARAVAREYRRLSTGFDVVESPEWKAEAMFLPAGLPLVVRSHLSARHVFAQLGESGIDARLSVRLEEGLMRRATLVTGTRTQLATVIAAARVPPARTRQVSLPVPVPVPTVSAPRPTVRQVVYVGRFEARKNPMVVVRAAPRVLEELPDARFVLAGRDTSLGGRSYLETMRNEIARLGVEQAVEIVDRWQDRESVASLMAGAAVCVMPSRWESFGLVAAEALALGRPLVASDIPSLADLVERGVSGLLAPPEDAAAWATALIELLGDERRAEAMGRAGAARIRADCDPAMVASRTLEVYTEAIAKHR